MGLSATSRLIFVALIQSVYQQFTTIGI